MNVKELSAKLSHTDFKLIVNESLPQYGALTEILTKNNIPFEPTHAAHTFSLGTIQMGFGLSCRFTDVYYLAQLFKAYGLRTIYPLNIRTADIQLGTYLHKFRKAQWVDFILGDPMEIDEFLEIDPGTSMKEVMDLYFDDHYKTAYKEEAGRDKLQLPDVYEGSTELDENRLDDSFDEEE